MEKNPLLKYMMKDKKADVVHTSAFSEAQNAGKIGAASPSSFSERVTKDRNRTTIKSYRDSKIVNDAWGNAPRAKTYESSEELSNEDNIGVSKSMRDKVEAEKREKNNRETLKESRLAQRNIGGATPISDGQPPARKNPGIFR